MSKCKSFVTSDRLLNRVFTRFIYLAARIYLGEGSEPDEKPNEESFSGAQGLVKCRF